MKKFEMLNVICKDCELTAKEKLVAQYFVYKSNRAGACYPSVDKIAEQCSVSRRTVQRATKKLAEKEYIIIEKRFKLGKQTSNLYSFNILLLAEMEREKEVVQEDNKEPGTAIEEIDLDEMLFKAEQEEKYGEDEEIDLDEVSALSVWDLDEVNPFECLEAREELEAAEVFEEQQQQISVERPEKQVEAKMSFKHKFYFPVTIKVLRIAAEHYERERVINPSLCTVEAEEHEVQSEGSLEASSNIMGAFFPP